MKNTPIKIFLIGFGLLIVPVLIFVGGSQSSSASTSNEMPTTPLSWCDRERAMEKSRPPLSKPIMSEEQYQQCIAALTAAPKTKVEKPIETPLPTRIYKETRVRRIVGNGILIEGPFGGYSFWGPLVFLPTDSWYERRGNKFIYVTAGVKRDPSPDRSHSAVLITVSDLAGNWINEGGIYEAPVQAGELTIVDAKGELLTLVTPKNEFMFFDVGSFTFITPDANTIASAAQRKTGTGIIVEKRGSPYTSYIVTNQWFLEKDGTRTTVFAGRTYGNSGEAVLLVTTSQGDPSLSEAKVYVVPGQQTSEWFYMRIFAVEQDKVFLVGNMGGKAVFDLSARRFLSPYEAAHLPDDPDLLTLEASFQKIRAEAKAQMSTATPKAATVTAYP